MKKVYDIGIVGAGLAGLTAAIQYAQKGYSVILFEKNKFPFHRVCGENISNESKDYLAKCGIDFETLKLPQIEQLEVSAPNGTLLKTKLDLGGFGISRYTLDNLLIQQAKALGVIVLEETKVEAIDNLGNSFSIQYANEICTVKLAIGSFGKRSNLDIKWNRNFIQQKKNKLNNYIGVKYHIKTQFPNNLIALHNFENGYCGISKIEGDTYCLCYLTTAHNLELHKDINTMERAVLYKNKYLKQIFEQAEFIFEKPIVISQISFDTKTSNENNVLLMGDACGMITPLCGNGMSMAMRSADMLVRASIDYLNHKITLDMLIRQYTHQWQKEFSLRLKIGRLIQANFGKTWLTDIFISIMKRMPTITQKLIRITHGDKF